MLGISPSVWQPAPDYWQLLFATGPGRIPALTLSPWAEAGFSRKEIRHWEVEKSEPVSKWE